MKLPLRILAIVCAALHTVSAADVTAAGGWMDTVTAANLASGAGSDLAPLESVSGTTILNVANSSGNWHLRARLTAGQWNENLTIWVKRTSDGSGSGTIAGGNSYVQLTAADLEIFSGLNDRANISLQFKITGLTRRVHPSTYNSSITFTVQ